MARVTVLYFASLRDAAGVECELADCDGDLRVLYAALRDRHGFSLPVERLRVAVDGGFVDWEHIPADGSEVAFIPPVSGG